MGSFLFVFAVGRVVKGKAVITKYNLGAGENGTTYDHE